MPRKGLNQSHTLAALANEAGTTVAPPNSVTLSPEELELWPIFASARVAADWRPLDLLLLADLVKTEVDIRRHQAVLNQEGPRVTTASGGSKANPLHAIIDTLKRRQLSLLRALGLTTRGDPRTAAAHAAKAQRFAAFDDDPDSLFAKPWSALDGKKQPRDW